MEPQQEYTVQLRKIKNLPALPEASIRIMQTINDPDASIDEVVDVLSLSPSLVARLLGLANSAYFCYPGKINDLRKAIIQVLGLNLVKSFSLSIVLNVQLDSRKCKAFDADYYWLHTLTAAVLAQKLSEKSNKRSLEPTIVYTSGLLLNIGILAAVYLFSEKMQEIFLSCQDSGKPLKNGIHDAMGVSHYTFGYLLLNHWCLPLFYQTIVKEFDNPDFRGKEMAPIILHRISQGLAASIISGEQPNIFQYQKELEYSLISVEHAVSVVERISARVPDIEELAKIISL